MHGFNRLGSTFLSALLVIGGAAGVTTVACMKAEGLMSAAKADQQRKVVLNLMQGTNDIRAVSMALELANSMLERGAEVTIYANLEGVRMFDMRQPDVRCGLADKTIGERIDEFVGGGGQILICPLCAKTAGIVPENLRPGARLASMAQIADQMLAADLVVDY